MTACERSTFFQCMKMVPYLSVSGLGPRILLNNNDNMVLYLKECLEKSHK